MTRATIGVTSILSPILLAVAVLVVDANVAVPTRLTLTAPSSVTIGESVDIEARLTTQDGQPVPGALLTLFQVGAVGQRPMARSTTDTRGVASFHHQEYTVAHLSVRVAFSGDGRLASSEAVADVEITGIKVPASVVMSHTPGPLTRGMLFSVLGAVWITYAFAGLCVARIIREGGRGNGTRRIRR